jgi:hypothetical protein
MQDDLETNYPGLWIEIIGVNSYGQESGAPSFSAGRDRPVLQDVDANQDGASDLWVSWDVDPRDVVILDGDNVRVGTYNLTTYDLEDPGNYATLRQMLIDAASESETGLWQNSFDAFDVNDDGVITPVGDVLVGINELNNHVYSDPLTGKLPSLPEDPSVPPPYLDVNGDGYMTAAGDVLPVINFLNNPPGEGEAAEGESTALALPAALSNAKWQQGGSAAAATAVQTTDSSARPSADPLTGGARVETPHAAGKGLQIGSLSMRDLSPRRETAELEVILATVAEDLAAVWYG